VNAGDDGICLKSSGKPEPANLLQNVIVADCYVYHAHGGFVIGSNTDGGMKNVYVTNCAFMFTDTGLRFKSGIGRGGVVENIFIENITMKDIEREAIIFDLYYSDASAVKMADDKSDQSKSPLFKNIKMNHIVCTGAEQAVRVNALPASVSGISVEHSQFTTREGVILKEANDITFSQCRFANTTGAVFTVQNVTGLLLSSVETKSTDQLFMEVSGENSKNIRIRKTNLKDRKTAIRFSEGADYSAVEFE
jgi:polygalacturonase